MTTSTQGQREQAGVGTPEQGLFLVGAERSGTTMARLMLDHHPSLSWLNEYEYSVDRVGDDESLPAVDEYEEFLSMHRVFQATGFEFDRQLGYADLVKSFLQQHCERQGKSLVGATVHRHLERLLVLWPDARFIHLVRDPRDVAPSVIRMGWAGNAYHACERWIHAERAWDRLCETVAPERRITVRFEDLLGDPENTLRAICGFVGIEYDPAMLRFDQDTSYDAPNASASYRWKSRMSRKDVALVEGRVGDLLAARGYQPSGEKPRVPGAFSLCLLKIQDHVSRIRWRVGRYGLGLYLRSRIARLFSRGGAWPRYVQRMNDIDREHLA